MRKIIFILSIISTLCARGQNFNFLYGGSEKNWGKDIVETYDHGFVMLASLPDQYGSINLIKVDVNGNRIWEKVIGTASDQIAVGCIIETYDHGFLIAGLEFKYDPSGNSFAMKLNECGEIEWTKSYGSYGNYDGITKAVQIDDNGYVLLANYIDNNRIVFLKIDSVGHLEFKKHFFDTSNATGFSLIKCMNGDLLFSGCGYYQNPSGVPAGWWQRGVVCRVDKNGNEKWSHILGLDTLLFSATTYCTELPDSSIICGTTWRSQANGSVTKPFVFKLNKNGTLQWRRFVGDTAWFDSDVNGIVYTDTNKIFLLSGRLCDPVYHGVFLYITDTSGIFQDSAGYDYDHFCWTGNLKSTSDHKLIYCGTQDNGGDYQAQIIRFKEDLSIDTVLNISLNYDSLCGQVIPAIEYLPFDTNYHVGVSEVIAQPKEMKIFPNPASLSITLEIPQLEHDAEIIIFNSLGAEIYSRTMSQNERSVSIDVSSFPHGIYFVKFNNYSAKFIRQ